MFGGYAMLREYRPCVLPGSEEPSRVNRLLRETEPAARCNEELGRIVNPSWYARCQPSNPDSQASQAHASAQMPAAPAVEQALRRP